MTDSVPEPRRWCARELRFDPQRSSYLSAIAQLHVPGVFAPGAPSVATRPRLPVMCTWSGDGAVIELCATDAGVSWRAMRARSCGWGDSEEQAKARCDEMIERSR